MKCKHGHDGRSIGTAGKDEMSSCCGAPVTYSGDGDLYCKCCYGLIEWADVAPNLVRIELGSPA